MTFEPGTRDETKWSDTTTVNRVSYFIREDGERLLLAIMMFRVDGKPDEISLLAHITLADDPNPFDTPMAIADASAQIIIPHAESIAQCEEAAAWYKEQWYAQLDNDELRARRERKRKG